jgi:hypothetical protein
VWEDSSKVFSGEICSVCVCELHKTDSVSMQWRDFSASVFPNDVKR